MTAFSHKQYVRQSSSVLSSMRKDFTICIQNREEDLIYIEQNMCDNRTVERMMVTYLSDDDLRFAEHVILIVNTAPLEGYVHEIVAEFQCQCSGQLLVVPDAPAS
jgi:hypothetical protein